MKNQGTEWLRHLPKVTQLVSKEQKWNPSSPAPKSEMPPMERSVVPEVLVDQTGGIAE